MQTRNNTHIHTTQPQLQYNNTPIHTNHATHNKQLIREIKLHGSFAHRNIVELWCSFQVTVGRLPPPPLHLPTRK